MWIYLIKISFRNIIRQKLASLLVLISLSAGLVTFILVTSYVNYEKSYDKGFPEYQNIYRIATDVYVGGELKISQPQCERAVGSALLQTCPNVISAGYFVRTKPEYKIGENTFRNENTLHASSGILDVFSIRLLLGNSQNVLNKPYKVLLSESCAKKYFGTENPLGKIVYKYPGFEYTVEGVFEDIPETTHFKADMLLSFHDNMHLPPPLKHAWGETNFYTYLKVEDDTDIKNIEKQINQLVSENKQSYFDKTNSEHNYSLQALKDIHLNSHLKHEISSNGRADYIFILQIVGLLIVLAAGLNYLYFSFVNSVEKASNTGILKIVGANDKTVGGMWLLESLMIHLIALVASLLISIMLAPYLSDNFGFHTDLSFTNHLLVWSLGVILTFSFLINGFIPAIKHNAIKIIDLLKLRYQSKQGKLPLRQLFVLLQFSIVIIIIISILGINKQVNYLIEKEKGISIKNKIIVRTPSNLRRSSNRINNIDAFEQGLQGHSNIKNVTSGNTVPGKSVAYNFRFTEIGTNKSLKAGLIVGDENFLTNYDIPLIHGQNFYSGSKGCIINETCLIQLGYQNGNEAIGKDIRLVDDSGWQELNTKIIGVTKDYNFQSIKVKPGPIVLIDWTENMIWGNYTVSLNTTDFASVIPFIKELFAATFTNYPFEYLILDDLYKKELKYEVQLLKILEIFVVIALIISAINLFSMAWNNASARIKEIGIRKVNGAKVSEILAMLNKDFVKWVAMAFVIACPIAWFAMNKWLENFAYKTTLSWWIFALAGVLALGIALLTVSWQSWRAATRNPVEALRYE